MEQRILLVDDEADILEFISYNLIREGYQVYTATNGKEAVAKAREVVPHLILLDVMMPEMDGIETCQEIRKQDELKNTLIAFLTARARIIRRLPVSRRARTTTLPSRFVSKCSSAASRHC